MMNRETEQRLLDSIKRHLPELEGLLARARSHWEYEDFVYRYYHQSFKVFGAQSMTRTIVDRLRSLLPGVELNRRLLSIIARYMLEMAVKYGRDLESPPTTLPSGWAAVLYLYELR